VPLTGLLIFKHISDASPIKPRRFEDAQHNTSRFDYKPKYYQRKQIIDVECFQK